MRWALYYFMWLFSTLLDTVVVMLVFGGWGLNVIPAGWGFFHVWLAVATALYVLSTAPGMTTIYQNLFPDKIAEVKKIGWMFAKRG